MRVFLRIFLVFALLNSALFAADFREIRKVSLKVNEQKKLLIKYSSYERVFKFRWTLYKNDGLVIFRSYDRVVGQNILYLQGRSSSFRVELKTRGADHYNVPYLLVVFKKFDYEKNEAEFEILLSDKKRQIEIEELQNR